MIGLLFISCEKEEIPVAPRTPGDVTISQVNMGGDYRDQIFFRLNDNTVVSQNLRSIWDLSFESSDEGWHVLINSSKIMKVAYYEDAAFEDDLNIDEATWKYDASTGNLDSTAIGDWRSGNGVYLIDRGYTHLGVAIGYYKFFVNDVDENSFSIRYSEMDGSNYQEAQVLKDKSLNLTYFSFDTGVVSVAPDKDSWDLLFTQYTYIFFETEEVTPYQVTGVLLNRNNVLAIKESDITFDKIDLEYAASSILSDKNDVIGYDWKEFNLSEGFYSVYPDQIYIIKDIEGIYYKLHFTGFYSDSGEKGAPKFEFQKL